MSTKFFNRKDEHVKKDAQAMTEEQFVEKYKDQTKEEVLRSVWADYQKANKRKKEIAAATDTATELVEVSVETKEGVEHTHIELPAGNGKKRKVYESETVEEEKPAKKGKKKAAEESSEEPAVKAGRTPRMRELIADKMYGTDKAKVRAQLEAEGFNCTGAGFHSEWHRLTKGLK